MDDTFTKTRLWGAVWTEDGPVAEVRDVDTREAFNATLDDPNFRWWALGAVAYLGLGEGHSRGPCIPGTPCKKCRDRAPGWWFEHGKRTKQRIFKPCQRRAQRTDGWSASEWGEKCDNLEVALTAARADGFPLVCEMDGHGKKLAWHEVSDG